MTKPNRAPALNVEITERQKKFLDSLPYGWIRSLISSIIDMCIRSVEITGDFRIIAMLMADNIELESLNELTKKSK